MEHIGEIEAQLAKLHTKKAMLVSQYVHYLKSFEKEKKE